MKSARCLPFAASLLLAACGLDAGPIQNLTSPRIIAAGDFQSAGYAQPDSKPHLPYTLGDLIICLDRPGTATITNIAPKDPTGSLSLDAFAVIPNDMERGLEGFRQDNRTIAEHGIDTSKPAIVNKPCLPRNDQPFSPRPSAEPQEFALVLQYSKADDRTAGNHGITIHYTSEGHQHSVDIDWEITLCEPNDTTTRECH